MSRLFGFIVLILLQVIMSFQIHPLLSSRLVSKQKVYMAEVEVIFPNNKKVKVASGSALKEAAKKAGFSPNYGCEEGKCGSCELKMNGKQKIRPCIGKVRAFLVTN